MKKKIIWILICVLILIGGWNVTAREWNQAESADFEYKENNANARAQSSDGQNISLEDVLQETETSIQYGELNSESKTENITGNSENSSTDNEKDDEENLGMSISVHNDRDDVTRFDGERKGSNFL